MKLPLVIFCFYINYVICGEEKYAVKNYPKKVKPYGSGKILINSKYRFKVKPTPETHTLIKDHNGKYTVFQVVGVSKTVQGVPDSPYFPLDQSIDHKPRVKKVLPDYVWSGLNRHKRSATEAAKAEETPDPNTEKNKTEITSTTEKLKEKDKEKTKEKAKDKVKEKAKEKEVSTTAKPEIKNDTAVMRSRDTSSTNNTKKEETKPEKKSDLQPERKAATKPKAKEKGSDKKDAAKTKERAGTKSGSSKIQRKAAGHKEAARGQSKKSKARNGTRSKTRSKGKAAGAGTKRHGRSKGKSKQHKRPAKAHGAKRSKTGKSSKKEVERNLKDTRRLTAAQEALIEDYPYVVSIQKDEEHWCTGSLLNPRLVITTANCLWKSTSVSRLEIRAGSTYTDRGGQVAGIQEVMKHPRWGLRQNPDNDVALILLDRNLLFSDTVHGVDLPNRAMLPAFEDAWVVSWGSERRDGIFDAHENSLQVYHSHLMSSEACNNLTTRFGIAVSMNFICFSQSGRTSPCTRDTGAPAVSDGVIWGMASWGIRKLCGTERFPSMFSYIASHSNMDFIANATRYLMADERFYPFLGRPIPDTIMKPALPVKPAD